MTHLMFGIIKWSLKVIKNTSKLIALCALCSCTPMDQALESWIGSHLYEATGQLGPYTRIGEYAGDTAYIWESNRQFTLPSQLHTVGNTFGNSINATTYQTGGQLITASCLFLFTTNQDKIINNWFYEGNNCAGRRYIKKNKIDVDTADAGAVVKAPESLPANTSSPENFLKHKVPDWIVDDLQKIK